MVSLQTEQNQKKYYDDYRVEILNNLHERGCRYAVIDGSNIEPEINYFEDKKELYDKYPDLKPGSSPKLGTSPLLIDFEKEKNSKLYQTEEAAKELRETNRKLMSLKSKRKELTDKIKDLRWLS